MSGHYAAHNVMEVGTDSCGGLSTGGRPIALNPARNDFHFEINGNAIARVQFKDERLKIDGTKLLSYLRSRPISANEM
jgi:hypothetical protein